MNLRAIASSVAEVTEDTPETEAIKEILPEAVSHRPILPHEIRSALLDTGVVTNRLQQR